MDEQLTYIMYSWLVHRYITKALEEGPLF